MKSSSSGGAKQNRPSGSSASPASFANYNFDFGLGHSLSGRSSAPRPLKDQKQPAATSNAPAGHFSFSTEGSRSATETSFSWAPNKPSWTHQPSPTTTAVSRSGLSIPTSMVGDIFGKSWLSSAPSTSANAGIGLSKADPNLFGDLLGSSLGKSGSTGSGGDPLKSAQPPKNAFYMGGLSSSIPNNTASPTAARHSGNSPSVSSAGSQMSGARVGTSMTGGPPRRSSMAGAPMSAQKDPFSLLMDFGSKSTDSSTRSLNSNLKSSSSSGSGAAASDDFGFGAFQNANPPKTDTFNMPPPPAPDFFAKSSPAPQPDIGGADPLDNLFASSASSAPSAGDGGSGNQPFSEASDWDLGEEFGGDGGGPTTELEGLPPPPSGVTGSAAKSKGMENYKQGQFPDAIKWLSWAFLLMEKSGDKTGAAEVLTCRASCYKEVGEYRKAVADCTLVLEQENQNVAVLLQRALLYESTEKYKLGAEDLRTVLKIDPANRLARTTIHRLTQLAG